MERMVGGEGKVGDGELQLKPVVEASGQTAAKGCCYW